MISEMNQSGRAAGIVIVCDLQGTICKVNRDELHLTEAAEGLLGQFLVHLVDRRSVKKTLNFLLELKTRGACFDWERSTC